MLQSVPPATLDPQLATNSETQSSTEALLGHRLAAFCATATHHSGWSILEAVVQDDGHAAAFVSFVFSFWLYGGRTLEQLHADWPRRQSAQWLRRIAPHVMALLRACSMLAKPTDARRNLADHIEFNTMTRHQRSIKGLQGLLCSPNWRGPRARA